MLKDRPVACQIRGPTDPQGDRWHGEAVTDEVFHPQAVPPHTRRHQPPPTKAALWAALARFDNRPCVQHTSPYLHTASAAAAQEVQAIP